MKIEPVKVTADTSEQFREALIEFLTGLSVGYRVRMDAVQTKKLKIVYEAKAQAIEDIVAQIRVFEIIKPISSNAPVGMAIIVNECMMLIANDKLLEAVKHYRYKMNTSLLEAKNNVENYRAILEMTENEIKSHCQKVAMTKKIEAIRDYRYWGYAHKKDIGLKEALDFINGL